LLFRVGAYFLDGVFGERLAKQDPVCVGTFSGARAEHGVGGVRREQHVFVSAVGCATGPRKPFDQLAEAQRLMAGYQERRRAHAREAYAAAKRDGTADTWGSLLRRQPLRVLLVFVGTVFALALVMLPVLFLGS
jgi:hypothetical protein